MPGTGGTELLKDVTRQKYVIMCLNAAGERD